MLIADERDSLRKTRNRKDENGVMEKWSNHVSKSTKRCIAVLACVICGAILTAIYIAEPQALEHYGEGTVLLDRNGMPLRIALGEDDQDCRPVHYTAISPWAVSALIAAEDKRFERHHGIDPLAIVRAATQNFTRRRRVSGASTISTQVIRLSEPRPRTFTTKIIETFKAFNMELALDKPAIIEQHLNRAPFGGNLTGIEAAGRVYFDKSAGDLTLAEAAMLAGLPQSPSRLRPDRHPQAAHRRMLYVLDRMLAAGFITAEQYTSAMLQPLEARPHPRPFRAPHFSDLILKHYPDSTGNLRTTLDTDLQSMTENTMAKHMPVLRGQGINSAAIVILEVETGAVRALTGSPDYFDNRQAGMVNGALAERSPGSALKPLIYAMALDQGIITPGYVIDDSPMLLRDTAPSNFDNSFRGAVSVREALVLSLNIPALKVTAMVGLRDTIDRLRELGLATLSRPAEQYGLNLALGGGEVTLLDLANAYACLARGGTYRPYRLLEEERELTSDRKLLSAEAAFMIADMLGGQERSADIFGHIADAELPRVAWKTGTSSGFRDAWTIAWNPEYVVGVWLGNHDGSGSPSLIGAKSAAPLAGELFRQITRGASAAWFQPPQGLQNRELADGSQEWHIPGISARQQDIQVQPEQLRIASPVNGSEFRLIDSPHIDQTITLQASGAAVNDVLHWFANGIYIGRTQAEQPLRWQLQPGEWIFICSTATGKRICSTILVRQDGQKL